MSVSETSSESEVDTLTSSDEDEEPKLNYEKITDRFQGCFVNDSISACAISKEHFFFGSHNGAVYIYSRQGVLLRKMILHVATVTGLSVDLESENLASCSMDGKLIVYNISSKETNVYDFKRPLLSVAIDPYYSTRSSRQIICGGRAGKVILSEKGWLGSRDIILQVDCGTVYKIDWYKSYVAWATDSGVYLYSNEYGKIFRHLEHPKKLPNQEVFPYQLYWQSESRLIIGWADQISIVSIQLSSQPNELPKVSVQAVLEIDSIVSGIMMFGFNILVLAYVAEVEDFTSSSRPKRVDAVRPELRLIDSSFQELAGDVIGLTNYSRLQPSDYHLIPDPAKKDYSYVLFPNDLICARERNEIDHVMYLVSREEYAEAIAAVKTMKDVPPELQVPELGKKYVAHLIDNEQYRKAALVIPTLYSNNPSGWEQWIFVFADHNRLEDIAEYLPLGDDHLSPVIYEMTLAYYMAFNEKKFDEKLHTWPTNLYSVPTIRKAAQKKYDQNQESRELANSLAFLYVNDSMPVEAFWLYLKLNKKECIDLVFQHNLYGEARQSILQLLLISADGRPENVNPKVINMLVQHVHSFPPNEVITQIQSITRFLYAYFCSYEVMFPNSLMEYGDLKVDVFAEFDRSRLFEFLMNTQCYSLGHAYNVCVKYRYLDELVYVLGRMGNNKDALMLIINELSDIGRAIRYVKEQGDKDLWEDLISYSLDKPEFICTLLENIGSDENALNLITRIPKGMKLPHAKDSISKLLSDHQLQVFLHLGCHNLFEDEAVERVKEFHSDQNIGFQVDKDISNEESNVGGLVNFDYSSLSEEPLPFVFDTKTSEFRSVTSLGYDIHTMASDHGLGDAASHVRNRLKPESTMGSKLSILMALKK
ncbi:vacuolar protein sorting-associated protein Vps41 [Schizosaccharomyces cryophilus OY26]|uniref:Vacuolar protein sorting-associated protein Vps41 n=1 Tax=Schizosaccharomyces cryophilus (strain OY26 / ATCC MYA-4695 / CBS 11777 / NBRC 106824 / NRRL Y48691) TaxID=653667 RepID=S9VYY0_SCHCR|nr:vacuolar protein sorting-associated protein Vps41 [Schizosaccharomyces cryophilus OY26]EPY51030.1 vacuolar protein sorting-associated protein Vps41 [Schizosaccharomyces cryophilus OY26]